MSEVKKKRNGLSSGFVRGKRKHTFTKADLEKEIKYMDIRAYCLKKMKNTQDYQDSYWMMTDENFKVYMQATFDTCSDFLGWMEGRIDQDE